MSLNLFKAVGSVPKKISLSLWVGLLLAGEPVERVAVEEGGQRHIERLGETSVGRNRGTAALVGDGGYILAALAETLNQLLVCDLFFSITSLI